MGLLNKIARKRKSTKARKREGISLCFFRSFALSHFRTFVPSRLRAFTLAEAIIAIVIIMVCFGLSTMIYINIIRSDNRAERSKAFMETKRNAIQTNMEKRYFDEEITTDSLRIKKTIEAYQNDPALNILTIESFSGKGRKLSSHKQIILSK
ncbi:MAG: hypothetical protein LBR52_03760 [Prevotellaceae bacterium]|jgi:Tfp pilus assembly protein PilE|nr:hypothetical protein [Prevotellaceae bacterium]